MVYDYLITLKRPSYKVVDTISQLLYLASFAAFLYLGTKAPNFINIYWISAVILLVSYIVVKVKNKRNGLSYYTSGLAIAAITWVAGPNSNWLLFALYTVCIFAEREVKFHKEIGFSADEVVFNTLVKKHYEWNDFQNLLIKDGLITLDFKNNKLVQKEIDGYVSADIEAEFNDFCRERMREVDKLTS